MKIATFDLEIAKLVPEGTSDLLELAPLGISCAAVAFSDMVPSGPHYFAEHPRLTRGAAMSLVNGLLAAQSNGYTIVTWNGLKFDFHVLAQESGMYNACANLALNHVDLMLCCTWVKGWFLGLDVALEGAGIGQKTHTVELKDGSTIDDMNGALAPKLWADGETEAVLTYLEGDVMQLLRLANKVEYEKVMRWKSKSSGRPQHVPAGMHLTVAKLLETPHPDTSWMDGNPPTRAQFMDWIPGYEEILEKYNGQPSPRSYRNLG